MIWNHNMLAIYPAILRNGRIEWTAEVPPGISRDSAVAVRVTFAEPIIPPSGRAMAAALEQIAETGGPTGIDDPVEWQREQRMERPLPERSA